MTQKLSTIILKLYMSNYKQYKGYHSITDSSWRSSGIGSDKPRQVLNTKLESCGHFDILQGYFQDFVFK